MKTSPLPARHLTAFACLAVSCLFPAAASAQTTVTTLADENDTPAGAQISLREALRDTPNGGQITLHASVAGKALVLTRGEMAVSGKTVAISAPGGLVIEARGLSRIFQVAAGAGLHLTGLTLQGGIAPGEGGAVLNAGTLTLTDCVLRDNRAASGTIGTTGASGGSEGGPGGPGGPGSGGGAVKSTGSLAAMRCHFLSNSAGEGGRGGQGGNGRQDVPSPLAGSGGPGGTGGDGGAILSAGVLTLTECIFDSNRSGQGGDGGQKGFGSADGARGGSSGSGGAVSQGAAMSAERCSFLNNECSEAGDRSFGSSSTSVPAGNSGSGYALYAGFGTVTLTNCTFTANRGLSNRGSSNGSEIGGTLFGSQGTQLKLTHCTVTENTAAKDNSAAGIVSAGPVECRNSVITSNFVNLGFNGLPVQDINFSPNTPRTIIPFGPLDGSPGINARLGTLDVTFGPLPVFVPVPSSLAVNTGARLADGPAVDQRGLPRPLGIPDQGAVEVQTVEPQLRSPQRIIFNPPALQRAPLLLDATSTSELPVSYELISGPATLTGNELKVTANGFVVVKATQPGNAGIAPALPVFRVFDAANFIPLAAQTTVPLFPPAPAAITLPAATSTGLAITWQAAAGVPPGMTLSGHQLTSTVAGSITLWGNAAGNAQFPAFSLTFVVNFARGIWWETPPPPFPDALPFWYTIVEGSSHGLKLTARSPVPATSPIPVPALPGGLVATPSAIPVGQSSVESILTLPANATLVNQTATLSTGDPSSTDITLFLANRNNVPLDIYAPAHMAAAVVTQVDIYAPGVSAGPLFGPPPPLGVRTFTVSAFDDANPSVSVPVTLNSQTEDPAAFQHKSIHILFAPLNRRVRLRVTTDDGITGESGPVNIFNPFNPSPGDADGDGLNDVIQAALQRPPGVPLPPPLTIERDASGLHAVLDKRPLNPAGWTIVLQHCADLQTWTTPAAAAVTVTPNPDGTTERVSILLPNGPRHYVRIMATRP